MTISTRTGNFYKQSYKIISFVLLTILLLLVTASTSHAEEYKFNSRMGEYSFRDQDISISTIAGRPSHIRIYVMLELSDHGKNIIGEEAKALGVTSLLMSREYILSMSRVGTLGTVWMDKDGNALKVHDNSSPTHMAIQTGSAEDQILKTALKIIDTNGVNSIKKY